MKTSKEIELILKARLEASDELQAASQAVANKMSTALEGAFSGLGAKIADKIMEGIVERLKNGGQSQMAQLLDQRPTSQNTNTQPMLPGTTQAQVVSAGAGSGNALPFYGTSSSYGYLPRSAGMSDYVSAKFAIGSHDAAMNSADERFQLTKAIQEDRIYNELQVRKKQNRLDPSYNILGGSFEVGGESRNFRDALGYHQELLKDSTSADLSELRTLDKSIQSLKDEMVRLREQNKDLTEVQAELAKKQSEKSILEDKANAELKRVAEVDSVLGAEKAAADARRAQMFGRASRIGTAVGSAMAFAGHLPGALRESAYAGSEVDNKEGRSFAAGEYDRLLAMQTLGGREAMSRQSVFESTMTGVGGILRDAIGGAMIGNTVAPGAGAAYGAIGGAAMGATNFVTGFNSRMNSSMEDQINKQMGTNKEFFDPYRAGLGTAMGSFRSARNMGAPELSGMLTGGEDVSLMMKRASSLNLSSMEDAAYVEQLKNSPNQKWAASLSRSASGRIAATESEAASMYPKIARARKYQMFDPRANDGAGGTGTLRDYASNAFAGDLYDQTMGQLTSTMGGVFGNKDPRLLSAKGGLGALFEAQGMGFANAPQLAAGLFQGGIGRDDSMRQTKEMFSEAVAAGLAKEKVGDSLKIVAAQASQGLGAAQGARDNYSMAMGAAQGLFGGAIEGHQMDFVQREQSKINSAGKQAGGIGLVKGLMGARGVYSELQNKYKLKNLSFTDSLRFSHSFDTMDIEDFTKMTGYTPKNKEEADDIVAKMRTAGARGDMGYRGAVGDLATISDIYSHTTDKEARLAPEVAKRLANPATAASTAYGPQPQGAPELPSGQPGAREAQLGDQKTAQQIAQGLTILSTNIETLNTAFKLLTERAHEVLKKEYVDKMLTTSPKK
jgi:hypothetical protein